MDRDVYWESVNPETPPEYTGLDVWRARPPKRGRKRAGPIEAARRWGRHTPVHVKLTYRGGPMGWVEVEYFKGRFYRPCTTTIYQLVTDIIEGDVAVAPLVPLRSTPKQRSKRSRYL